MAAQQLRPSAHSDFLVLGAVYELLTYLLITTTSNISMKIIIIIIIIIMR